MNTSHSASKKATQQQVLKQTSGTELTINRFKMKVIAITVLAIGLLQSAWTQDSYNFLNQTESNIPSSLLAGRKPLTYPKIRESDILWSKKVWQIIDTREKMNQAFRYPKRPFFDIVAEAIASGTITAYDPDYNDFSKALDKNKLKAILFHSDTFEIFDPITFEPHYQVVTNNIEYHDIHRYRIKEVWYFDTNSSTMRTKILGIAPIRTITTDAGIQYEEVLFWLYYPNCREVFARQAAFLNGNDRAVMSWEDVFEMRKFSSYIYKENNVKNERLADYTSGAALLIESNRLKAEIFNFEQDLWSY